MSSIKATHINGDVSVGRNVAMGGALSVAGNAVVGHDLKVEGWLDAPNLRGVIKGIFETAAELALAYPHPELGWVAGVGTSTPFDLYAAKNVGGTISWVAVTGGKINIDVDISQYEAQVEAFSDKVDVLEAQVEDFAEIVHVVKTCTFDVVNQLMINAETGGTNGSSNGEGSGFIEVVAGDTYFVTAKFVGIYGIAGYSSASADDYCANIASKTSSGSAYQTEFAEDLEIVIPQGVTHIRISTYDKTNYPISLKHRISIKKVLEDLQDDVEDLEDEVESLDGLKAFKREIYPEYAHNREGYWRLYDYDTDNPYISFAAASGWHCVDAIPIEVGDEFDITTTGRVGVAVHALLDENQGFIALLQEWNTPSLQHFVITQEQYDAGGRYVVFSFRNGDEPSVLKKVAFSPKENDERITVLEGKLDLNIYDRIRPVYAFPKAAPAAFRNKLALIDHDIEILMVGDSVTGFTHVVSTDEVVDAANRPCGMQRNGLTWLLWNSLCNNKPQCDRFDSEVNAFTESENNWQLSNYKKFNNAVEGEIHYNPVTSNGNVGEFSQDNSVYRECDDAGCSVSFGWDLDAYENLAFIHRLGCDATTEITITCTTGKVEVYDEGTSAWVEANGYTFSQFIQYTTPVAGGSSCWVRQMILKMRKASEATGSVQLNFTNTGSGVMYYWGTERYNGNTLRVINLGKGGRTSSLHLYTLHDEIAYRHPDLVIYQLPVWNELKSGGSYTTNWNQAHKNVIDLIKAQSNNWANYQMMIFIPHTQAADWDKDRNKRFQKKPTLAEPNPPLTDEVSMTEITREEYVLSQYDAEVPIFNFNPCIIDFAHSLGIDMETLLGSTSSAITDGTTSEVNVTDKYTADGVHMSATGAKFTANCLLPILR